MRKDNNKPLCDVRYCGLKQSRRCSLTDEALDRFVKTIPSIKDMFPGAEEDLRNSGLLLHEIYEYLSRCEGLQDRVLDAIERLGIRFPQLKRSMIAAARSAIEKRIKKASSTAKPKSLGFDEESAGVIQQPQL